MMKADNITYYHRCPPACECTMFGFNKTNKYWKLNVGNRERVKYWPLTRAQGIQDSGNLRVSHY